MQQGKFRFEIEGEPPTDDCLQILAELDCVNEIEAPVGGYDGALLMGGNLSDKVRPRLVFLTREYRRHAYFRDVYLLGSKRPLNPEKGEGLQDLMSPCEEIEGFWKREIEQAIPKNEIEMMQFVAQQAEIPQEWEIRAVAAPDVSLKEGGSRAANTGETFIQWQKYTDYVAGRFLISSNQPFVHYQEANARRILPRKMEIVGIGPAANTQLPLSTFLDNLAKQFYEENLLHQRCFAEK